MASYDLPWILTYVRAVLKESGEFTFPIFVNALWTHFEKAGLPVQRKSHLAPSYDGNYTFASDPHDWKQSAIEAWSYLQRRGFIVPKTINFPDLSHVIYYRLTDRGVAWAKGDDYIPEDSLTYMQSLNALVPTMDSVVKAYVTEGLSTFENGNYFAAAVMVGAASEKCLYLLAESMFTALKTQQRIDKLRGLYVRRKFDDLFEEVKKNVCLARSAGAPHDPFEISAEHLTSLYRAVQQQRNDAVHPMNANVSEHDVRLTYMVFPGILKTTEKMRTWFSDPANSGTV